MPDGNRLAFSTTAEDKPLALATLSEFLPGPVRVETLVDVAKVSIVGVGMRNHPGVAARFFTRLAAEDVRVHLVTTSEIKISAIVERSKLEVTARALHAEFGLDAVPPI